MQEGSRIHRMIQKRMGPEYEAEVGLSLTVDRPEYRLIVEGRADGIIRKEGKVTIDEIKGTYRDVAKMKEPVDLHLAQAKCYAYMLTRKEAMDDISVQMTYCNIETQEIKYFNFDFFLGEIESWFEALLAEYQKWTDNLWQWKKTRQASIAGLSFPYPYRDGQKELVTNVYHTIYHKKKLFLEAPTGVGKTLATLFPAVCAMGQGMGEKLFFLTAKTITRTVAEESLQLLRGQGLKIRSVILTAKEKICFQEATECNPEKCPYAKGHFDRINAALFDMLISADNFDRGTIESYARKHMVCPFELALDLTLFSDAIICDYNYAFDPHVYLKRHFGDGEEGKYLFLIDEAHNLLERGRAMYSATLWKESFLALKDALKREVDSDGHSVLIRQGYADKMIHHLGKCNQALLSFKRECPDFRVVSAIDTFVTPLMRLQGVMGEYLSESDAQTEIREHILEFYFDISHFLEMYELVDENYVKYTETLEDGSFFLKLFCVNPSENLKKCMLWARSTILFSATFLPIQYYKKLLGGEETDYEVYAKSVFDPSKCGIFVAGDVTSRYTRRDEAEFYRIACYIEKIVRAKRGNYMVFCPSYAFLRAVYAQYEENFGGEDRELILQDERMREEDREAFLSRFQGNLDLDFGAAIQADVEIGEEETTLIGFCVLGGAFGEGIDLKRDQLIGAIIVGTGIPQVCHEREILKDYFDEREGDGFDYAYRYPGMDKVLQAAGRVIRTTEDIGVVALLDERFHQAAYRGLFPREWVRIRNVTDATIGKQVELFWSDWERFEGNDITRK